MFCRSVCNVSVFQIDVGANTSWTLTELVPHTNYTIAIRCRPVEGGYWSYDSYVSGVTLEEGEVFLYKAFISLSSSVVLS